MPFPAITIADGPDISGWAETARITSVEFTPTDFLVRHTREGTRPDSWPGVQIPGWGDIAKGGTDKGEIQWTLWVIIQVGGRWLTGGCIEYWAEAQPSFGVFRGSDPAPFSTGAQNWWYQIGAMATHQPGPGDRIGLIAVAGDQRSKDLRSVEERSDIVWVEVPPNSARRYDFQAPIAPPVAPEPPTPNPEPVAPPAVVAPPTPPPWGPTAPWPPDRSDVLEALLREVVTKADLAALRQEIVDLVTALAPVAGTPPTAATVASVVSGWLRRR